MTSKHRLQILLALVGVLALLASVALAAGTMRPTEATWQDTVAGEAEFGTAENVGKNRARATSAYGSMTYRVADQENLAKVEVLGRSESSLPGASTGPITRSVRGALLNVPATVDGTVCARSTKDSTTCSEEPSPKSTAFAQASSSNLRVSSFGLPIVRYAEGSAANPAIATAACTPGQKGAAGFSGGESVTLGRGNNSVEVPVPGSNSETRAQRKWGLVTYTARLQRTEKASLGYAKSELRLHVEADGATGDPWILHIVLANAECGVSQSIQENLPQPTATNFASLVRSASAMRAAHAPAALEPITDMVEDEVVDDAAALEDELGETAELGADADAEQEESELPSLADVGEAGTPEPSATTATTAPTTNASSPATSAPADSTSDTTETSAPEAGTTVPVTSEPAATVPAAPESVEPTTPTSAVDAPQQPQDVRVGRSFTVTGADGAELGTAKVEDIVRTPGCGVELTLSITTSDEAGTGRWASIGPDDFAEVRPGGTTRDAQRISSDCEQAANSRTTALSPSNSYEIVIAFLLDDSASRAMLRPEGTAGWIFDLPALTLPTPPQPPVTTTATSVPETTAQTAEA